MLHFNHCVFCPQVYFVLAIIYCFGPVSNYNGKDLLLAPMTKATEIQSAADKNKHSFGQFWANS